MPDRNENRRGYKKTPVGWIPEEWGCHCLGSLVSIQSGNSPAIYQPKRIGRFPFVKVDDLNLCTGVQDRAREYSDVDVGVVPEDSTIFAKRGAAIATNKVRLAGAKIVMDSNMMALIPKPSLWPKFLFYSIQRENLYRIADTSPIPQINNKHLEPYPIPLPPLPEQKKIAEILSTWDEGIEQTRQLIAAAKRRKKALMQQLLTGKKRLPGFGNKWPTKTLFSITERIITSPVSTDGYPVLSITAGTGFVSQEDKFSKVIAGRHIEHYVLLRKGEFSYNKGNSYRYPQGCVYRLQKYDVGLVPDVFYSFRLKAEINPEFVEQFFHADLHGVQLRRLINTGVRNNGLLNLNASDFFNLKIPFPEMDEQRAIAAVLKTADDEIASLESKLSVLEKQKKGLMQKLLTGEIRVKN
jgi:type I restriction enzyme S subunit